MSDILVEMKGISKSYGPVTALKSVDFSVRQNEVIGLLGDNGAGKSTLIKILSGRIQATRGEIFIRGQKIRIRDATDAMAHSIETIHQDSALVTQLSIARNLFLGREPLKGPRFLNRMDQEKMNEVAGNLLREIGITKTLPGDTLVSSLSGGERQAVSIARALYFHSDLIILDEPTNNLGVDETKGVLRFIRRARDSGHSSIFIAHNIHHVFQVVDRIVVLRGGEVIADDIDPKNSSIEEVEHIITGFSA